MRSCPFSFQMLKDFSSNLRYIKNPPWDSGITPPELLEFIAQHPAGRAIDLGCGTGTNLITLAKHGWQVSGVDVAILALHRARRKAKIAQVDINLHWGDVTKLSGIHEIFDLALDMGCFHNLGDRKEAYLKRLDEILAPKGFWLLYAHLLPRQDGMKHGVSRADLDLLASRFTLVWQKVNRGKVVHKAIWTLFQK